MRTRSEELKLRAATMRAITTVLSGDEVLDYIDFNLVTKNYDFADNFGDAVFNMLSLALLDSGYDLIVGACSSFQNKLYEFQYYGSSADVKFEDSDWEGLRVAETTAPEEWRRDGVFTGAVKGAVYRFGEEQELYDGMFLSYVVDSKTILSFRDSVDRSIEAYTKISGAIRFLAYLASWCKGYLDRLSNRARTKVVNNTYLTLADSLAAKKYKRILQIMSN